LNKNKLKENVMSNEEVKHNTDTTPQATAKKKAGRSSTYTVRKRALPPPICKIIEKAFKQPVAIKRNGEAWEGTAFEGIMLTIEREIAKGKKSALPIKRQYEVYAAARPKVIIREEMDYEEAARAYAEFCRTGVWLGRKPPKLSKADQEMFITPDMTQEEAAEIYEATLKGRRTRNG
jgi:hypothetical protein